MDEQVDDQGTLYGPAWKPVSPSNRNSSTRPLKIDFCSEAACAEFDGGKNILTAYLNDDKVNGSAKTSDLTYYSCPPSQR